MISNQADVNESIILNSKYIVHTLAFVLLTCAKLAC